MSSYASTLSASVPVLVGNTGTVSYDSNPGHLKFSTGFEDVSFKEGSGGDNSALWLKDINSAYYIHNWITDENTGLVFIDTGSRQTYSPTPHGGHKMLGTEVTSTTSGTIKRAQIKLFLQRTETTPGGWPTDPPTPWIQDEYFLRAYYYIDPNWELNAPISWNWCSLMTIQESATDSGNNYKKMKIAIRTHPYGAGKYPPLNPNTDYEIAFDGAGGVPLGGSGTLSASPPKWTLTSFRGGWHLWEVYVKRGPLDINHATLWIDGVKLLDGGGFPSLTYLDEWTIDIPKLYFEGTDTLPKAAWFDDLQIWDGNPGVASTQHISPIGTNLTGIYSTQNTAHVGANATSVQLPFESRRIQNLII